MAATGIGGNDKNKNKKMIILSSCHSCVVTRKMHHHTTSSFYGDYITFVQQCPLINKTYGIAWDTHNNILHYRIQNKPQTEYYNYLSDKATLHYQQMQHMAQNFEKEVHCMDTHMEEIDTKLLYWEQHATHQVTKGHDQITK